LIRKLVNGKVPVSKRYFKTRQLSVNCLAGKSNSVPTNWVKVTVSTIISATFDDFSSSTTLTH
jgi:hypothetical protein